MKMNSRVADKKWQFHMNTRHYPVKHSNYLAHSSEGLLSVLAKPSYWFLTYLGIWGTLHNKSLSIYGNFGLKFASTCKLPPNFIWGIRLRVWCSYFKVTFMANIQIYFDFLSMVDSLQKLTICSLVTMWTGANSH